jgi:phosphatidylglycerol---prolipoprotein diacylglyceryl transferase
MINITPDPVLIQIGGLPIYWYGIGYAVGLATVYWLLVREARHRGEDVELIGTGLVIVAIAALVGGRAYHVIDQWARYQDDLITAILPLVRNADGSLAFAGFSGLGVPGGIVTGTAAAWVYTRRKGVSFARWADIVAPALFAMQAIGRWGNFFNQELYGPPTSLPWGIAIECQYRTTAWPCSEFPFATTGFHPLFFYESLSGVLGLLALLWLGRRFAHRLVAGDLLLVFLVWYGATRFLLEPLRSDNWTFYGVPVAQLVTLGFILTGLVLLWYRHGPGRPDAAEPADDEELPDGAEPDGAEPDETTEPVPGPG